jgi:hypothetical protein
MSTGADGPRPTVWRSAAASAQHEITFKSDDLAREAVGLQRRVSPHFVVDLQMVFWFHRLPVRGLFGWDSPQLP